MEIESLTKLEEICTFYINLGCTSGDDNFTDETYVEYNKYWIDVSD